MQQEPIIFLVCGGPAQARHSLEEALRQRYVDGYRIAVTGPDTDPASLMLSYLEQGEQIAVFIYEQSAQGTEGATFLERTQQSFPDARRLLFAGHLNSEWATQKTDEYVLLNSWQPAETKLYPILDELLADWRASMDRPFTRVRGVMTVRIRIGDSLQRAAEVIALSGVSDLMIIDDDNKFVGVLSVGDVLRAAMPDVEEIMEQGGTLEQAFRLFLRKGSDLMYKPVAPLVITNPLVVDPDDHVAKAAALMLEKNIHRLPVVKDGHLIGTVGRTDICQAVVGTL